MTQVRFIQLRVEYPPGTGDYEATKLGDQLRDFGMALGDAYIEDEGLMEQTNPEPEWDAFEPRVSEAKRVKAGRPEDGMGLYDG